MKIKLLFLSLLLSTAFLFGQSSPHLVIYGTVYGTNTIPVVSVLVQAFNSQGTQVAQDSTDALGQYELFIQNGSVIGPNQVYTITVADCNNQVQSQTVSNQQGTVDMAVINFYTCLTTSFCHASFVVEPLSNSEGVELFNTSTFSQNQSETATYIWAVSGNGITYTESSIHLYITNPGNYNVCLTITTSSGCSSQYCDYVIVEGGTNPCNAEFTFQQVSPNSILLTPVQDFPVNAISYQWQFPNGETSNLANPVFIFPAGIDSAEICLTIVTPNCTATHCMFGTIETNPNPGISLSGQVSFVPNIALSFPATVGLYSIDSVSGALTLVETVTTTVPGGQYIFNNVQQGSYYILATPGNGIVQLAPTYYGNTIDWQSASIITVSNASINNLNIILQVTNNPGGNGGVNGNVELGPGKLHSDGEFFSDISVIITLPNGNVVSWSEVGSEGEFNINNLPYGVYHIWAEKPGYYCMKTEFELSAQYPLATMTIKVITQGTLEVVVVKNESIKLNAFPNPFNDVVNIGFNASADGFYQLQIFNTSGQLIHSEMLNIAKGNQTVELSNLNESKGMYFVTLNKDGVRVATKNIMKL